MCSRGSHTGPGLFGESNKGNLRPRGSDPQPSLWKVMTSVFRFPDWCSLSDADRVAALAQCQKRLAGIGRRLNAVEHIYPADVSAGGPLSGLPYVAKDMFATGQAANRHGDVPTPQAPALPRASVIDRLDQAGRQSDRRGHDGTWLTSPPVSEARAQSMALRCDPRRVLDRLRHSCRVRLLLRRAWFRYRRLGANSGTLLRHHRLKPGYGRIPLDGAMRSRRASTRLGS